MSIRIKSIELINFESHEHTVLEGFSDGFNCICADSDVGKSSILRGVKVCAYNSFDPEMVRTGAAYCEVKIVTTAGSVHAKRGENVNEWVIHKNGQAPLSLDKVGRHEVKEACEVLGIKMIHLGGVDVPVNIMDQLEPHFFIAGVGDTKTSPSTRTEIIDEICGLSGTEELIKRSALDKLRLTKELNKEEEELKSLQGHLYDEALLASEVSLSQRLDVLVGEINACNDNRDYVAGVMREHAAIRDSMSRARRNIDEVPKDVAEDVGKVKTLLVKCENVLSYLKSFDGIRQNLKAREEGLREIPAVDIDFRSVFDGLNRLSSWTELYNGYSSIIERLKDVRYECNVLPSDKIDFSVMNDVSALGKMCLLVREYGSVYSRLNRLKDDLQSIPRVDDGCLKPLREEVDKLATVSALSRQEKDTQTQISVLREGIEKQNALIAKTEQEYREVLSGIDVCPVTNKPIGDKCSLYEEKGGG